MIKISGKMKEINIDQRDVDLNLLVMGFRALNEELNFELETTKFGQYYINVGNDDDYIRLPIKEENYEIIRDSLALVDKLWDKEILELEKKLKER